MLTFCFFQEVWGKKLNGQMSLDHPGGLHVLGPCNAISQNPMDEKEKIPKKKRSRDPFVIPWIDLVVSSSLDHFLRKGILPLEHRARNQAADFKEGDPFQRLGAIGV